MPRETNEVVLDGRYSWQRFATGSCDLMMPRVCDGLLQSV